MMGAPRELGVPFLKALVVMDTRLQEVQQLSIYKTFILQNRVKVQVIIPLAKLVDLSQKGACGAIKTVWSRT